MEPGDIDKLYHRFGFLDYKSLKISVTCFGTYVPPFREEFARNPTVWRNQAPALLPGWMISMNWPWRRTRF
jgi:hypothetical protein